MKSLLITMTCLAPLVLAGCARGPYAQEAFSRKVLGKSSWLVRLSQGKPDEIKQLKGYEMWEYKGRTYNPETRKRDLAVWLTIKEGKVVQAAY
jgi:hypothetical protein